MSIQSKEDLLYYLEQDRIALKRPAGFVLQKDNIWKFEILLRKAEYYCNCMPGKLKKIGSIYKRRLYRLGAKCGGFSIPINCFGLRTNFRGELFSGSKALLSLADEIIKMDTNSLCVCGEPAEFNARKINNKFTTSGEEVEIDQTNKDISYVPLCGKCYYEKVYTKIKKKL